LVSVEAVASRRVAARAWRPISGNDRVIVVKLVMDQSYPVSCMGLTRTPGNRALLSKTFFLPRISRIETNGFVGCQDKVSSSQQNYQLTSCSFASIREIRGGFSRLAGEDAIAL
jgi:hypothetical protein